MSVKLSDIAARANVSTTTVSNVLRGRGRFSAETEKAVIQAAEEMGYFQSADLPPDKTIGLMFCRAPETRQGERISDYPLDFMSTFTFDAVEAIDSVISEHGYQLVFQLVRETDTEQDLPNMVRQRTIRGSLLIGGSLRDDFIEGVDRRGIPTVLVFTSVEHSGINSVLVDYVDGAYQATKHLIDLGHKRIGFVNGWRYTRTSEAKLDGYRRALGRADLDYDPDLVLDGDFTFDGGYQQAKKLLSQKSRPTALFVADDLMALGAISAASDLGLSVPGDLAIVGFGDGPMAKVSNPKLTTVHVPTKTVGEIAAKRLIELLEGDDRPAYTIMVAVRLVIRDSCGGG